MSFISSNCIAFVLLVGDIMHSSEREKVVRGEPVASWSWARQQGFRELPTPE